MSKQKKREMKKNQFKVINRLTREEQIFNCEELVRFFQAEFCEETKQINYKHQWNDYAVSSFQDDFFKNVVIAVCGVAFVVLTTKIIMQWL